MKQIDPITFCKFMICPLKKYFLVFILLLPAVPLQAAFENKGAGSMFLGAGSAGAASSDSSFKAIINPAGIGLLNRNHIDFQYRNFYQLEGLNQFTLAGSFRIIDLPLGIGINSFGNNLYSELETSFIYSHKIVSSFYLGISLNTYWLSIKNYGSASSLGIDLAGYYIISRKLRAAFIVENINEPVIGQVKEKLPAAMTLAAAFKPIESVEVNMDLVKDNRFDFEFRFGVHYKMNRWLGLACGFREQVNSFSGGFFIQKSQIIFSYALEYHQTLGNNHSVSIGYAF